MMERANGTDEGKGMGQDGSFPLIDLGAWDAVLRKSMARVSAAPLWMDWTAS